MTYNKMSSFKIWKDDYYSISSNSISSSQNNIYYTQQLDKHIEFMQDFFLDFDKLSKINDLHINKDIVNNIPLYRYLGITRSILIEIQLIYKWGPKITMIPSPWFIIKVNNSSKYKIQFAFSENPKSNNIFLSNFILNINNNDTISFKLYKDNQFSTDTDFTLLNGSFIHFKTLN